MKTIITGIDFTKSSYNAARYAAMLATKTGSKLTLFNMFDIPLIHTNSGLYFISYSALRQESEKKIEKTEEKLRKEFPKVEITRFLTTGSFKQEINIFIENHRVNFVVLGLATKTRFSRFLYGSHSTELVGKVSAPVIIVPDKYHDHKLKTILLAVDNKENLHHSSLLELEALPKSNLKLVHVRTPDELFDTKKIRTIKVNKQNTPIETILANNLSSGLKKHLSKVTPDMIGILSRKHSIFYDLFNESNSKQVVFASKVPVLSIHE